MGSFLSDTCFKSSWVLYIFKLIFIIQILHNITNSWIFSDIGRNCLLGNRKKIAKFLMRTFTCCSTFLYARSPVIDSQPGGPVRQPGSLTVTNSGSIRQIELSYQPIGLGIDSWAPSWDMSNTRYGKYQIPILFCHQCQQRWCCRTCLRQKTKNLLQQSGALEKLIHEKKAWSQKSRDTIPLRKR